jgi:hypothetical protein
MSTDTPQTDTHTTPDAVWRATVIDSINEALSLNLPDSVDASTVANSITNGISDIHRWQGQAADVARAVTAERDELAGKLATVTTERNNSRAFSDQLLDSAHSYHQILANRLGLPYETAADAVSLCDTLAPRLVVEGDAVKAATAAATVLPDVLPTDEDGDTPSPAHTIRLLTDALRHARRDTTRANEALTAAKAEADTLRSTLAATQADLRAARRARDSWRDATAASARAAILTASALAKVAATR